MPTTPGFVAVNVTHDARNRLRSLTYALTGKAGRRVTLSDALMAALDLAERHPEEIAKILTEQNGESS